MDRTNQPEEAGLSLASVIHLRPNGLRSVNIERDLANSAVAERYLFTAQSRASLDRLLNRFNGGAPTRAWTLTGPYGSGKSFFSLFLMNLACATQPAYRYASDKLREVDSLLAQEARRLLDLGTSQGLLPIPITGYRASLQECFKHGFGHSLAGLSKTAELQPYLDELNQWSTGTDSRTVIRWLEGVAAVITNPTFGYRGLLIVFDELGKPLEYASAHPDTADVYILQEVAEFANRSNHTPLLFIGILHQGFERYAAMLDSTTQREWAKVQGRFEDIAFQEPASVQMRLVAEAIEAASQEEASVWRRLAEQAALEALEAGWCPPLMAAEEFATLCRQAYPLHPTVLVAMPFLFRRLAQNERSLFAYLGSREPFGFQEFLQSHRPPAFIRLADLFDYLMANFQGQLYASGRARVLTETMERLDSDPNLQPLEQEIVKTIGLLNWLSGVSHLQATEVQLLVALRSLDRPDEPIREAIERLQTRSLIVYRRFNQTYHIWQGSDVDLEERLQQAQRQLSGTFSLAEAVQRYRPPRPLVARRHSYETGTLRYFDLQYVDGFNRDQAMGEGRGASGRVLICLPAHPAEQTEFEKWAQGAEMSQQPAFVVGIVERTGRLAELLGELRGLHWVGDNTPELRDDPVARRELRARLAAVESLLGNELERLLSLHQLSGAAGCAWYHRGERAVVEERQGLSHLLSQICDQLFEDSPRLRNELINRRVLSSQGAAARRNLIEGMLSRAAQPNLGIEGYPPERSMYESLLKRAGLHWLTAAGQWSLGPLPEDDPLHLRPVWEAIANFIFTPPPKPRPVSELYGLLGVPPFGLTEGVLPVLLCAFLISHYQETTLYREGTLLPEPSIADWEVLLRRPELFDVVGVQVTGPRAAVVERLARGLGTETAVLPVVRELIRRLRTLPEYTWRTQNLSATTLALRQAVERARAPEQLLFHDLPTALEVGVLAADEEAGPGEINRFFERLNGALQELAGAMPRRIDQARDQLLAACGLSEGEAGWLEFRREAAVLLPYVNDSTLLPLLKRAAETADPEAALESVLAYIANRPARSWSDADVTRYGTQVKRYGAIFREERSGYDPMATLSPAQRDQSQRVIEALQQAIASQSTRELEITRAALRILLKEVEGELAAGREDSTGFVPGPGANSVEGE